MLLNTVPIKWGLEYPFCVLLFANQIALEVLASYSKSKASTLVELLNA